MSILALSPALLALPSLTTDLAPDPGPIDGLGARDWVLPVVAAAAVLIVLAVVAAVVVLRRRGR